VRAVTLEGADRDLRWQAWRWALANRSGDGTLRVGVRSPASTAGVNGGASWSSAQVPQAGSHRAANPAHKACTWSGSGSHRLPANNSTARMGVGIPPGSTPQRSAYGAESVYLTAAPPTFGGPRTDRLVLGRSETGRVVALPKDLCMSADSEGR
jgi:hypothetical protein